MSYKRRLSDADFPEGWRPYAERLDGGYVPAFWRELGRLPAAEQQRVIDAVVKAAFQCRHSDPRNDMAELKTAAAGVTAKVQELTQAVWSLEDTAIRCHGYYDQLCTDPAWPHLPSQPNLGESERVLSALAQWASGMQYLASCQIDKKQLPRRFCRLLWRQLRWASNNECLPAGFHLSYEAESQLLVALFDLEVEPETIRTRYSRKRP